MLNPDQASLGSKINLIFAICCFLSEFYFTFICQKRRSFEEIDKMYIKNIAARKSKSFILDTNYNAVKQFKEGKMIMVEHNEA